MQPFFVMLTGFALGARRGVVATGLYLVAGFAGLPVFAGGAAGLAHLFGPTGGFLAGFLFAAFLCGASVKTPGRGPSSWPAGLLWGLAGLLVLYALGVARMIAVVESMTVVGAVSAMAVFFGLDVVKLAAAVAAARLLARSRLLPS
jgi:biotin transport system substrate-specific component